ncbi:hypothetical protein B6N60_04415 [Richelia sinica FACHB-800]|uniref:Uncharacterized protein n=1 Tax=Richelia sinica FACHB-800 TaxID=1357546 RepID=A0A975Y6W1_9NOST|nr:hypothetical protein [Richelia sinica]MBD2665448.1 hypothetical protein [Richelia sinica FACHB-800]QXE25695.1 hypothetical protein B6N60_04415 [Richelia sinica FACHB-800]
MLNQQQIKTDEQVTFAEALSAARRMQEDWLQFGLNFVHIYVEDVESDWLETWGDDEVLVNPLLDKIKDFLVSDHDVAVTLRNNLGEHSLFDLAVNLEECLRIAPADNRISAVENLFNHSGCLNDINTQELASKLIEDLL